VGTQLDLLWSWLLVFLHLVFHLRIQDYSDLSVNRLQSFLLIVLFQAFDAHDWVVMRLVMRIWLASGWFLLPVQVQASSFMDLWKPLILYWFHRTMNLFMEISVAFDTGKWLIGWLALAESYCQELLLLEILSGRRCLENSFGHICLLRVPHESGALVRRATTC